MIIIKIIGFILYCIGYFLYMILCMFAVIYGGMVLMTLGAIIPYHLGIAASHFLSADSLHIFNIIVWSIWFICLCIIVTLTMTEE